MYPTTTPPPLPAAVAGKTSPWRVWHFVVVFLGGAIMSIVGLALGLLVGGGIEEVAAGDIYPDAVLAFSVPAQIIGNVMVLFAIAKVLQISVHRTLGFEVHPMDGLFIFVGAAISLLLGYMLLPLAEIVGADDEPQATTELLSEVSLGIPITVAFFSIVVFVPMVEELLFRGILQRAVGNYLNRVSTILVTGIVFGVVHLVGLPNPSFGNVIVIIVPLSLLGILLSWIADRDGRIGRTIALHTGINALAFIAIQLDLPI